MSEKVSLCIVNDAVPSVHYYVLDTNFPSHFVPTSKPTIQLQKLFQSNQKLQCTPSHTIPYYNTVQTLLYLHFMKAGTILDRVAEISR